MKKAFLFFAALAAFVGCQKKDIPTIETPKTVTFIAEAEKGSKATLNELTFNWEIGDKIGVWATKADAKQLYSYTNKAEVAGSTGIFEGNSSASSYDFAIYPLAEYGSYPKYFFKLPNTFTNYKSGQVVSPMISLVGEAVPSGDKQQYSGSLNFKHLCGMIKLSITGLPEGTTSVSWTNDGYYPINGQCDIITEKLNEAQLLEAVDVMSAVTNGTASKTTTFTFDALATRSDMVIYVPLLPGTYETGFTIKASNGVDEVILGQSTKAQTVVRANVHRLSVDASSKSYPVKIIDVLTAGTCLKADAKYTDAFSWTSSNGVTYSGYAMVGTSSTIQLNNKNSNVGIISSTGGLIKSVTIDWNSSTVNDRTIEIFGKETPYSSSADLYIPANKGTLIGTITKGESTSLTIDNPYEYIGIYAPNAVYLNSVTLEWIEDTRTPLAATTSVTASQDGIVSNTINVEWDAVEGAGSYYVELFDSSLNSVEIKTITGATSCSFEGLEYKTEYLVSVIAVPSDPTTLTVSSETLSSVVTTGEDTRIPLAATTSVTATIDGEVSNKINVEWDAVENAGSYYVELFDNLGNSIEIKNINAATTCFFEGLEYNTTYYVNVIAFPSDPSAYLNSVATTSINVTTGEAPAAQKKINIDFSAQGYTNQQVVTSFSQSPISISFTKGGSNDPKYYTSGNSIRIYGGGTMSISTSVGNIIAITITYGTDDKTNEITTNVGSFTSPKWTGESSSVTFSVASGSGHRRIKALEIIYGE